MTVRLRLESQQLPDAASANVIGELRGREQPDEIVLIGAHLDSWDVGQGAHDDGAGCVAMMQALTVLRRLGLTPRRTIRVVLFTNEENGLRGGKAYAADHAAELRQPRARARERRRRVRAARVPGRDPSPRRPRPPSPGSREIAQLLAPLGATTRDGRARAAPTSVRWSRRASRRSDLMTDARTYFDFHHTEADTLDKVDPAQLAEQVAAIAVLAYVVAELPHRIDHVEPVAADAAR